MKITKIVNIISYIIAIFSVVPLIKYLNIEYEILLFLAITFSLKFEIKKRFLLNIFAVISIIFTLRNISLDNFIIPILNSLTILLSVKFMEEKKYRDYMQIYLLSLLMLAGYALLSINIIFLLYLTIILILLSFATIFLTYYDENKNIILNKNEILKVLYKTFFIFLLALPVSIVIFVILPRIETPFFNFFNNSTTAVTGFSDKISIGDVSNIQEDNSVIFRVKMKKISEKYLYWRGIVLDKFNGKTWEKSSNINYGDIKITGQKPVKMVIYLEPYYNNYLFTLDKPVNISLKKVKQYSDLTFQYYKTINRRLKYKVYSIITKTFLETNIDAKSFLELPENISKNLIKLSKKFTSINQLENFFIKSKFKYSLQNLPVSKHPIDDFIFKYKHGNCEYFASAFAILLRLMGIPSRIIAGYRGGIYSELGKYYIITQKDAHTWVEAYKNGKWIRIDPVQFASNASNLSNFASTKINLKLLIDLINYYWITMFINYDFNTQFLILKKVVFFKYNIGNIKKVLIKISILFLIIIALVLVLKFAKKIKAKRLNKELALLNKFLTKLEYRGFKREKTQTLHEFLSTINNQEIKKSCKNFILIFEKYYFKDQKIPDKEYKKLLLIIRKI